MKLMEIIGWCLVVGVSGTLLKGCWDIEFSDEAKVQKAERAPKTYELIKSVLASA